MFSEVITMDTGQGEAKDPGRGRGSHTVEVLVHNMVDMALEVATTAVSTVAIGIDCCSMDQETSCKERHARPPGVGCDSETRVLGKGYLANMMRWDTDTPEDNPVSETEKMDNIKNNP